MEFCAVIIEDTASVRNALIPAMRELAGIKTLAYAEDFAGAIHLLKREACDLVVLDLFLRSGSGLDVLNYVRGMQDPPPVVMFTNYAIDRVRQRCLSNGAAAVFDKTSQMDEFIEYCLALADQKRYPYGDLMSSMAETPLTA